MIDDPDLAIILVAANRCLSDRLIAAVRGTGARDARPAFGFVIRAVDAEEPTVTRLAELLGVSRQAASKLADEMVQRGYLLRAADPDDRRRTRLRLSAKGRRVRKRAAEESATIEAELRAAVGDRAVDGLRRSLLAFVEREGALDEVRALRSRAPGWARRADGGAWRPSLSPAPSPRDQEAPRGEASAARRARSPPSAAGARAPPSPGP